MINLEPVTHAFNDQQKVGGARAPSALLVPTPMKGKIHTG